MGSYQLTFDFSDPFEGLWDVDATVTKYEPTTTADNIQWLDMPIVGKGAQRWRVREEWADTCRLGIFARRDGNTAISGDVEITGKGIMATTAKALAELPRSYQLDIYTTVPPLVKTFTKNVRLALPNKGNIEVYAKLPPNVPYAVKKRLPTGNFNQWNVARQLARHWRVKWHLVESLPSAEKLLNLDFTLDEVEELQP